ETKAKHELEQIIGDLKQEKMKLQFSLEQETATTTSLRKDCEKLQSRLDKKAADYHEACSDLCKQLDRLDAEKSALAGRLDEATISKEKLQSVADNREKELKESLALQSHTAIGQMKGLEIRIVELQEQLKVQQEKYKLREEEI